MQRKQWRLRRPCFARAALVTRRPASRKCPNSGPSLGRRVSDENRTLGGSDFHQSCEQNSPKTFQRAVLGPYSLLGSNLRVYLRALYSQPEKKDVGKFNLGRGSPLIEARPARPVAPAAEPTMIRLAVISFSLEKMQCNRGALARVHRAQKCIFSMLALVYCDQCMPMADQIPAKRGHWFVSRSAMRMPRLRGRPLRASSFSMWKRNRAMSSASACGS